MAIYIRTRPTIGIMMLGCLLALIAVGIALLFPAALFLAGYALASMEEAVTYPTESSSAANGAAQIVMIATTYSIMLTAVTFGTISAFKGNDQRVPQDATVTHRDIESARFLHVSQVPDRRAAGMLWAVLAGMLLVASPFIVIAVPYPLIFNDSTQELFNEAVWGMIFLVAGLFVALTCAAMRRRSIAVRMTPQAMSQARSPPPSPRLPAATSSAFGRFQRAEVA